MRVSVAFVALAAACSNDPIPTGGGSGNPPGLPDIPDNGFDLPLQSLGGFTYTVMLETGLDYTAAIVDTGSSTTAVASSKCGGCGVKPIYTPGTTAKDKSMVACTQYADGSGWSGEIYTDQSWLRGPFVSLDFVAITSQSGFFDPNGGYQGIIGMGPKQLLEQGTGSYMDGLAAQYPMTESMAFRLCPYNGDMWIDGYDPDAAMTDPQFTPMLPIDDINNPFYSIQIADIAFGTTSLAFTPADFGPVLLDTGTSISYIPTPALNKLLTAINTDPTFKAMFPGQSLADTMAGGCVTTAGVTSNDVDMMLPKLSVSYPDGAGSSFAVAVPASQSYLYPAGMGQFCLAFSSSGPDASGGSLIGDTLLTGMLTIFDVKNLQVGLAPQKGCDPFDPLPPSMRSARLQPSGDKPWYRSSPYFRPRPLRAIH